MNPNPQPLSGPEDQIAQAADAWRVHADERWVEISDRVQSKAMSASRRSMPVRAASVGGPVNVSQQVLVASIRSALDDLNGAAPVDIQIATDERNHYTGVFIALNVDYQVEIIPIADEVRDRARATLTLLLGVVSPPITVTTMHVHVDDVRHPGDP